MFIEPKLKEGNYCIYIQEYTSPNDCCGALKLKQICVL